MTDLEDFIKGNDVKTYATTENIPIYKEIIWSLLDFFNSITSIEKPSRVKILFNNELNRHNRIHKKIKVSKALLVHVYYEMLKSKEIECEDSHFLSHLRKCAVRTDSGVSSFAILLSPYPEFYNAKTKQIEKQMFSCKHNCYFCPDEEGIARSYVKGEPAVDRGINHNWQPDLQLESRLDSLKMLGHKNNKIELILEGGTYSQYPKDYLIDFNCKLFYTANTWNDISKREMLSIEEEMLINRKASIRIIGICIETRPDTLIGEEGIEWLKFFRKTGTTRVQLGCQHTDKLVLKNFKIEIKIKRN